MFTIYSVYVHYILTICSLYIHYTIQVAEKIAPCNTSCRAQLYYIQPLQRVLELL